MKKRRLGRKGIKLRNRLILVTISLIMLIVVLNLNLKENKQIKYEKQTRSLINAQEEILNNTEGTTYYIADNGTSVDGTDINNPMSLAIANSKTYVKDDKILFKSGDTFYGSINFEVQTSEDEYIYIGAYGEGEKPIISGANILIDSQAWTLEEGLYKLDLCNRNNFEGIAKTSGDFCNIGFLIDENGNIYGNRKKAKDLIENEFEFYCEDRYIYIKCSGNPSERLGKIILAPRNYLVNLSSNTIMENLNIQNTGAHGIVKKTVVTENVLIKNCIIQNIGGSVMLMDSFTRYGNAIEFWNQADNVIVENCVIRNTYDAGFTFQGSSVTTGFSNIKAQNNIFINCTYPVEIFCRNDKLGNDAITVGIEYCTIENNISINQGIGWGYEVRPDKDPAAELVIWDLPKGKTTLTVQNNKYFNPRRIYYVWPYENTLTPFKENVVSDNNFLYLNENTYLQNKNGNYEERQILSDYNKDKMSTFRLSTTQELNKINKETILTSNNYTEIKTYYETLEKDFTYTDAITPIQQKYTQFKQQNQTTIKEAGLTTKITQLETYLQQANSTNTTQTNLTQQINQTYELGTTILTTYLNNNLNITEDELLSLLQQINEIGKTYNTLYSLLQTQETTDFTNIQNKITETEQIIERYQTIGLTQVTTLINDTKTTLQSQLQDTIKSTSATYLIDWAQKLLDIDIINYINQNPPDLTYSTTSPTNKDVVATITTNYYIEITNNNNSPTHTFTKNGSFTFEYTVRNKKYTVTAMVTNIDKTPPTITGVEENQLYYIEQEITPKITDTNLKEATLYINGVQIDYKIGQPLIVEGLYKIIATDEAGNTTTVQFQVMEKPEEKYIMQENSIQNIKYNTTKTKFDTKVKLQETYTIERKKDNETIQLETTDTIASGDILTTTSGKKYTLIVAGDLTKDGQVDIQDFVRMRRYLLGLRQLDEVETLASDANTDSKDLSISDYIRIRILILNQMAET